jgi:dienelactone hydrolase
MIHERDTADLFAFKKFNAVVVDSWSYRGFPTGTGDDSMCKNFFEPARRLEEIYKTVEWIKEQPWHKGKIFLVGYSHGAMVALEASLYPASKGIDKAVGFYPFCRPHNHTEPAIPVQIHIGTDDDWTPANRCRGIYNSWFKKYKYGEYYEYSKTTHSFDIGRDITVRGLGNGGVMSDHKIRYNQESTKIAYDRVYNFLKE